MNLDWTYPALSTAPVDDPRLRVEFADLELARRYLAEALPAEDAPLAVTIFNVWWIPGKSFEVIYEVKLDGARTSIVTLKFFPRADLKPAFEAAAAQARAPGDVCLLEAWGAVLFRFPYDARLSALPRSLDLARVSAALPEAYRARGAKDWSLLSYLPRDRASLRYRFGEDMTDLAGKLHGSAEATHEAMRRLWVSEARGFRMPEPVAFDAETGMRWEAFLPGSRFDLEADERLIERQLAYTLSDLARLHAVPLAGLPTNGREAALNRIVRKVTRRIDGALPGLSPAIARFMIKLEREAERVPRSGYVTMHGDFHTANVIFDGERPGFIDLDNLAYGEAAYDLALFASRLLLAEVVSGRRSDGLSRLIEDLPRRYRDAGGEHVTDEAFAWYMAALLVGRQLKTCIRHWAPDLPQVSGRLLNLAETILEARRFTAEHHMVAHKAAQGAPT